MSDFRDTRRVVAEHQGDLQKIAYLSSPSRLKPPGRAPSYLLAKPGWLLDVPIPLNEVKLLYDGGDQSNRWQRARETATALMPHLPGGRYRATYSQALVEYDGRTELFNGFSYRLLDVDINEDRVRLKFGDGHYFDYLDTGEVLAYEAARALRAGRRDFQRLRVRRFLRDPFDFGARVTSCGVITLTLRREGDQAGFYLHRRNPRAGNVAAGQLHAVPAGEFAPATIATDAIRSDLSLWKNIVREYAEEMLGVTDARGRGGRVVDFEKDEPFSAFTAAAAKGALECYFLGIGLDPLTWKPEILTACVFEAEAFDEILRPGLLAAPVPDADDMETEGTILMGTNARGIPFEAERVDSYLRSDMRDAGRTCLSLAWHHRRWLGIDAG